MNLDVKNGITDLGMRSHRSRGVGLIHGGYFRTPSWVVRAIQFTLVPKKFHVVRTKIRTGFHESFLQAFSADFAATTNAGETLPLVLIGAQQMDMKVRSRTSFFGPG